MATAASSMEEPRKPQGSLPIPRSKRGVKGFFSEVGREMKKVSWPSVNETNRLTGVVLSVCILAGFIMIMMGSLFGAFIDFLTKGSV
jgi:preprotein translocase SecE subunit